MRCAVHGGNSAAAGYGLPPHGTTASVKGIPRQPNGFERTNHGDQRKDGFEDIGNIIMYYVSGSCGCCPKLAASNPNISAHVYDIRHFETLKDQYRVMSVPCLVINNDKVSFGKKNLSQILALLS